MMLDPVTLATITSAVTVLATESAKGITSEASKDIWGKIKRLFGWSSDPKPSELAPTVAARIQQDAALAEQIVSLLRQDNSNGSSAALVGSIVANKSVVATTIDVKGDFNM